MPSKLNGLSEYKSGLSSECRKRYEEKINIVGGVDPYEDNLTWDKDIGVLPSVTHPDIIFYLLFTPSPYTKDDLKAWKSLDAVNQVCSGWVQERSSINTGSHVIVTAKVLHSQRIREKPLRPWVIAQPDGVIAAAHCNCMAGLGEACTHIAALLFSVGAAVQVRDSRTVTEKEAYWKMLPSSMKGINYKEVSDINFTSAKTSKKHLDHNIDGTGTGQKARHNSGTPARKVTVPKATEADFLQFCSKISKLNCKPAVLSVVEPFADSYIPVGLKKDFPLILSELKNKQEIGKDIKTLQDACKKIEIACSKEQSANVESETRLQSRSKLWYDFRAGRITASNVKSVMSTDIDNPAPSLIKKICYPDSSVTTPAMKWGTDHESNALKKFAQTMAEAHDNTSVTSSGFVISTEHPYIGASPDGLFVCDCCGSACVEVKCPFRARNELISPDTCDFLVKDDTGNTCLSEKHQYFFQIQTQLGVLGNECGYFVVWTLQDLFIQQIKFNSSVWSDICSKSKTLMYNAVLPELVGKVFTLLPKVEAPPSKVTNVANSTVLKLSNVDNIAKASIDGEQLYCFCNQVESGRMIGCDGDACDIVWFHFTCLKLERAPRGKWFCPDCRKLQPAKRQRLK